MIFRKKKLLKKRLVESFGHVKTEGFNFDLISRYHNRKMNHSQNREQTDQLFNDLDIDLFFRFSDRTCSKVGQQFIFSQLLEMNYQYEDMLKMESRISIMMQQADFRLKLQELLHPLNSQQAYYICDLFQVENNPPSKWYKIFPILSIASIIALVGLFFASFFLPIFLVFFGINCILHFAMKRSSNVFVSGVPALLSLGAIAKKLSTIELFNIEAERLKKPINTIRTIRKKMAFLRIEQKVDSDIEVAYWYLLELIKISLLLEPLLLFQSKRLLHRKSEEIEALFCFVGEVDKALSIASLRQGLDQYCVPYFSHETNVITLKGMRHPLIEDCVPNDVDFKRSVLLMGSNMSGKTTYIRAIGLTLLSGKVFNTCFAESACLPEMDLLSMIRVNDDLLNATSYYFKELKTIQSILDHVAHFPTVVLLDELFKGTNTVERIAAAKAVLSYLNSKKTQVFVSTHDLELAELLEHEMECVFFSEQIVDGKVLFDHQLKKGKLKNGNAIHLLALNGFPKEIVDEARRLIAD